jgi:hypothetical protein
VAILAGAAIGWACCAHLGDDVRATRVLRSANLAQAAEYSRALPAGSALIAVKPFNEALGPLMLERGVLGFDPMHVPAEETATAAAELLSRRRVFVDFARLPPAVAALLRQRFEGIETWPGAEPLVELTRRR